MQAVAQKNTFVVVCQGEEARLQAVSEAERAEWVETIKRCIDKLAEVVAEPTVPALDLTTRSAQAMPAYRGELLWAVRRVMEGYCEWQRKPEAECAGHLKLLHGEWELADSVGGDSPTDPNTPHLITIVPALDNKYQPGGEVRWPDDLPLAPWC